MQRILVVTKFRYLGDTIVATPFLRALKDAYPEAEITLLGGPAIPTLLSGCPYLSQIWSAEPGIGKSLGQTIALAKQIKSEKFDVAFLLNRSLHSALMARLAGIPQRIGHDSEHRGLLLTRRVKYDWTKPDRECALDLARAIGIETCGSLPQLWITPEEQKMAQEFLISRGSRPSEYLIGMQPGAHDPLVREWGAAKFAEVANRLADKLGARIVILGSEEERAVAEEVSRSMAHAPIILSGETNLRQALAIISLCRLWIGNDGGLLHAAVGLGPATVGIFGPTKAARWGYNTAKHRTLAVHPELQSAESAIIRKCLDSITVDSVFEAALAAQNADHELEVSR